MKFNKIIAKIDNVKTLSPQGKELLKNTLESLNDTNLLSNKITIRNRISEQIEKAEGISSQEKDRLKNMIWLLINRLGAWGIALGAIIFGITFITICHNLVNNIPMHRGPGLGAALALSGAAVIWGTVIEFKIRSWFQ